ncbi:hypothetical protein XENTR_v10009763 [Xenopus tropicalis]|uniref:Olfactory receptor n=1 Tax=Xenopus tropicalis TaxID=8364 RepID=A0A803JH62_XENTR|nr:hypothetical protein XENTR_v10009763 [Xenopus tropicalis]|eukprot:XP_002932798.1 PREDICTED: olfactory receptor 1G1-like [Xenopus tropicalis]
MSQDGNNITLPREFHFSTFSNSEEVNFWVFVVVLMMYLLIVLGNTMIATLICLIYQLHTPMYFFLCNLAVQDILYASTTMPKLMAITATGNTDISFQGCITQIFVFDFCIITEFFLLVAMAFDRYVAIGIPLHYLLIMRRIVCVVMASTCWVIGGFNSLLFTLLISKLSFCSSKEIDHFFCDPKALLKLSCSDTTIIMSTVFAEGVFFGFLPCLIVMSYASIISTIVKIQTSEGRRKAFSRCSSHLTIVIIFFGTSIGLYLKPQLDNSLECDKFLSLLYVALVPILNPLVYTLRNKQVLMSVTQIINKKSTAVKQKSKMALNLRYPD